MKITRGANPVVMMTMALVAVGALAWAMFGKSPSDPTTLSSTTNPSVTTSSSSSGISGADDAAPSGLAVCEASSLPKQADEVVRAIRSGGPFAARKDGTTFGNRERLLPSKPNGFYREYTVPTPGANNRGARRIVTGGNPKTDPQWFFYTGDHYESFCEMSL